MYTTVIIFSFPRWKSFTISYIGTVFNDRLCHSDRLHIFGYLGPSPLAAGVVFPLLSEGKGVEEGRDTPPATPHQGGRGTSCTLTTRHAPLPVGNLVCKKGAEGRRRGRLGLAGSVSFVGVGFVAGDGEMSITEVVLRAGVLWLGRLAGLLAQLATADDAHHQRHDDHAQSHPDDDGQSVVQHRLRLGLLQGADARALRV